MNIQSIFKQQLIKIIFAVALLSLVIIWALMSANGRKLNFSTLFADETEDTTTPVIIETGGIRIRNDQFKTNEITAEVNGMPVTLNEYRIENLDPGEYNVLLKVPGQFDWSGRVSVEPRLITDISPFFFSTETKIEPKLLPRTDIDRIFFSRYGDYAYYVVSKSQKGTENGIFRLQLTDATNFFSTTESQPVKVANIFPQIAESITKQDYELLPSLDNRKLIFISPTTPLFILDTQNPNLDIQVDDLQLMSIEKILGFRPAKFDWFKGSSSLIIENNELLAELTLSSGKTIVIEYLPESKPIYGINGDSLLVYSPNDKKIYRYKDEVRTEVKLANITLPEGIVEIWTDRNSASFLILKDTNNKFFYLNTLESFLTEISTEIEIFDFSNDGTSLLYKDKEGKVYSYVIEEIIPKNEFRPITTKILGAFDPATMKIGWNSRSSHILLYEALPDSNLRKISAIDKFGTNKVLLIESDKIVDHDYYMLSDNKELIILMEDTTANETESAKKNLYTKKFSI